MPSRRGDVTSSQSMTTPRAGREAVCSNGGNFSGSKCYDLRRRTVDAGGLLL